MTATKAPAPNLIPGGSGHSLSGKVRLGPSGVHWYDRWSGLNILLDDLAIPSERWSAAPRYVSIALTNACELRCPFCYAPKIPGRLEAAVVIGWIEELDKSGGLGVGFGGGEPTAHPHFPLICAETAGRTSMAVTFTTHGHRIDAKLAAALRGSVHFIRLSMDGLGPTYQRLRGRPFEAFQRHLAVVATIAPFGLNAVVNDETVDELDAIAAFARREGASELLLLPEQPIGHRSGISRSASQQLTRWVSRATPGLRLAVSEAGATDGMPLAKPFGKEEPLEAHAHVDARGILKANAYAATGVPVGPSIMRSLSLLRAQTT
jgi:MoaA/NifB/PqqE/SkfB family radical SAM enzyme